MHKLNSAAGIRMMHIKDIELAGINPDTRSNLPKAFCESIRSKGVLTPLVVNQDNVLVDGHRRRQACEESGITEVPVITMEGDPVELFCAYNEHTKPISGAQWTQVALKGGLIPEAHRKSYDAMLRLFTLQEMHDLYKIRPFSCTILADARAIARYIGEPTPERWKQIIEWILRCGVQIKALKQAMGEKMAPEIILSSLENNKPVRIGVVVGEAA